MNKAKQNNSSGGASSGRLIQIELPLEGTNTKLNINPTTTAQQVHDIIINRPFYKNTAYAFSLAPSDSRKTALQPNTQLAKQQTSCFTFIITGISATVRMEHKGTDETFQFGSDYTVKECLLFIEHCDCFGSSYASSNLKGENFSSLHELYLVKEALSLPHAYSCADGIKMQNDKLLSSYRLKHGDCLVFARSKKIPNFWSTPPSGNISILITEPETKKSQTMSFPPTTSYFEVIGQFLERVGIKESRWFYGMYVELDNNSPKYYLHREWTLQTFHLPSPARLECRKKKLPKREWFGVDPDSVPLMKDPDNGIKVPQVLLILKDLLQILDGPASEGIFRKAGLQSEMEKIRQQFLDGLPFECYNQHSIATLLKRWYKAIPTRLLEGINREDDSDEFALKYPTYLSKTETRLMSWLLDLLLDVVTHEATNLMDAKNLAIVWGPGMTGSSEESNTAPSPMDMTGFSDTRFGINFIQVNVAHFQETGTKPYGACDGSSNGATAKCIMDHSKRAPGELELKAGDIVTIVDNTTQDWAFVSQNGKYGFVAKGFISVQNSAEASEPVVNS